MVKSSLALYVVRQFGRAFGKSINPDGYLMFTLRAVAKKKPGHVYNAPGEARK